MRIWSILLAGAGLGVAMPALADGPHPGMTAPAMRSATVHRWGPRHQGRWYAGWYAPGGWGGYRRPAAGYVLPRYWVSPAYVIRNYGAYGLPAPVGGYGWSRYYDDAVMTDAHGRVRDYRSGIDWDAAPPPPGATYDDDVTARDMPPPRHELDDRAERPVQGGPGVDYDAPSYAGGPPVPHHSVHASGPGQPAVTTTQAPGYFADGYYYPGAITTRIVLPPATTTVTEVISYRKPAARKVRRLHMVK